MTVTETRRADAESGTVAGHVTAVSPSTKGTNVLSVAEYGAQLRESDLLALLPAVQKKDPKTRTLFKFGDRARESCIHLVNTPLFGIFRVIPLLHAVTANFLRGIMLISSLDPGTSPNEVIALHATLVHRPMYRLVEGREKVVAATRHHEPLGWKRLLEQLKQIAVDDTASLIHMISANALPHLDHNEERCAYICSDAEQMFDMLMTGAKMVPGEEGKLLMEYINNVYEVKVFDNAPPAPQQGQSQQQRSQPSRRPQNRSHKR